MSYEISLTHNCSLLTQAPFLYWECLRLGWFSLPHTEFFIHVRTRDLLLAVSSRVDRTLGTRYIFTALFRSADPSRELSCIARPRFGACSNNCFLSCFTLFPVSRWGRYDSNCILCVTHLLLQVPFIHVCSIYVTRVHSFSALLWFLLGGYLFVSSFPSHTHTLRFPWSTGLTLSVT